MDLFTAIKTRRSVRAYGPEPITDEQLAILFDAAHRAPSARNRQPWKFVAVRRKELIESFFPTVSSMKFAADAPALIIVCYDKEKILSADHPANRGQDNLLALQDTALAAQNLMLAATAIGLGTCWMGMFDEEACLHHFDIPENLVPVAILSVGTDRDEPRERRLRPVDDLVLYRD